MPHGPGKGCGRGFRPHARSRVLGPMDRHTVMGDDIDSPNANKTYYRVVAVDAQGKQSGSSDYATAPRPTIHGKLATHANVAPNAMAPAAAANRWSGMAARLVEQSRGGRLRSRR